MIEVPLSEIDQSHVTSLVEDGASEKKTLEFKRELPSNTDADKKEFLADVSSFANATGGDLIYGIQDRDGLAESIHLIDEARVDVEVARLENILRDGLSPRLPACSLKPVKFDEGGAVILLRIGQSLIGPHMVSFKGSSRFYGRNANGKFQLDVDQIRDAFLLGGQTSDKMRDFRLGRVSQILAGNTPVLLRENSLVIVHFIPLQSFRARYQFDPALAPKIRDDLEPLYGPISGSRFNADGLVAYNSFDDPLCTSYVQLFNNAIIEAANSDIMSTREQFIPSILLEISLAKLASRILPMFGKLAIDPPIYLFLTMTKVKGRKMAIDSQRHFSHGYTAHYDHPVDRDTLILPDLRLDSLEYESFASALLPVFNSIWQAAGWPHSHNFDQETGEWLSKQGRIP
jgi:hypothetical protein